MNPPDWSDFQKLIADDFVLVVFFKFFRSVGYNNYLIENIPYCVCNSGNNCFPVNNNVGFRHAVKPPVGTAGQDNP